MTEQALIEQSRNAIWGAVRDYGAHTSETRELDDISNAFVNMLAEDSVRAKKDLRELLSRSDAWNDELQALVINGTKTHNPDPGKVGRLAKSILLPAYNDEGYERNHWITQAIDFFCGYTPDEGIEAIKKLAPHAYAPNKKKSRIFKSLCDVLKITDESAGSEFSRLYAQLADELNGRKIDFKLFVSINPAHFLTMSNPKHDDRGSMLTSCHSLNSIEYQYNNGCSGYARDSVTMIAFVASDPNNPETLNNRKTMRQLFMYKPYSGILLQSRLYSAQGGVYGKDNAEEYKLYRDLIQREISKLEAVPNRWKTVNYISSKDFEENVFGIVIPTGRGFGGYPDWKYRDWDIKISVRRDCLENHAYTPYEVGTYGLCIMCGRETDHGLYCSCHSHGHETCDVCDNYCDETFVAYNSNGREIRVCSRCLNEHFESCICCDGCYPSDDMQWIDGEPVCQACLDRYYEQCDDCGSWHHIDDGDLCTVYDQGGEHRVCSDCMSRNYEMCDYCEDTYHSDCMNTAYDSEGNPIRVCYYCYREYYSECRKCGRDFDTHVLKDGLCPDCYHEDEED